jgi:hypothetical protein
LGETFQLQISGRSRCQISQHLLDQILIFDRVAIVISPPTVKVGFSPFFKKSLLPGASKYLPIAIDSSH